MSALSILTRLMTFAKVAAWAQCWLAPISHFSR
jgi:hypothetical protein